MLTIDKLNSSSVPLAHPHSHRHAVRDVNRDVTTHKAPNGRFNENDVMKWKKCSGMNINHCFDYMVSIEILQHGM